MASAMAAVKTTPLTDIINKRTITSDDLRRLERDMFPRGIKSADEVDVILHLSEVCQILAPDWAEFFTTTLADYIVNIEAPRGAVSEAEASALIEQFSTDGVIDNPLHFELLVKVAEQSRLCSDTLIIFILNQVRDSAINGNPVLRTTPLNAPPALEKNEIDVIKRIFLPTAARRPRSISQAQAAFLMDLNDILDASATHASWTDLYAKIMTEFALDWSAHKSRDAKRKAEWIEKPSLLKRLSGHDKKRSSGDTPNTQPGRSDTENPENILAFPNADPSTNPSTNPSDDAKADAITWFAVRLSSYDEADKNTEHLLRKLRKHTKRVHSSIATAVREECSKHGIA